MERYYISKLSIFVLNVSTLLVLALMYIIFYQSVTNSYRIFLFCLYLCLYMLIMIASLFKIKSYVEFTDSGIIQYSGYSKSDHNVDIVDFADINKIEYNKWTRRISIFDKNEKQRMFSSSIRDFKDFGKKLYTKAMKHNQSIEISSTFINMFS